MDHVIFKFRIADAVAFKDHVIPDRRQQPVQRFLGGLFAGQSDAHGMAGQIVIGKVAFDFQQLGDRPVAAEILQQIKVAGSMQTIRRSVS